MSIDYTVEASGILRFDAGCQTCWSSAAIGYSVAATPLQMAAAYAAIHARSQIQNLAVNQCSSATMKVADQQTSVCLASSQRREGRRQHQRTCAHRGVDIEFDPSRVAPTALGVFVLNIVVQ